jgi:transposase-like protein
MSKRRFKEKEIKSLLKNKNVTKCSNKAISYNKSFKIEAVRQYNEEGKISTEIFQEAGFDLKVVGKDTPTSCLKRWRKIYKVKGQAGLSKETRGRSGGRPKTTGLSDAERIEYMEAEIAYLKEENSFLAKLRAKRKE